VLGASGKDAALRGRLATMLDGNDDPTWKWVSWLPDGQALSAAEKSAVVALRDESNGGKTARALFRVRFGAEPDAGLRRVELMALWSTLDRLPESHVAQGSITNFAEFQGEAGGLAGVYDEKKIGIQDELATSGETEEMFEQEDALTKQQILDGYGITEEELQHRVAAGEFVELHVEGITLYRRQKVTGDKFTLTVLHEVGHAVDDMLGNHTDLVFGLAGWRHFDEGSFAEWAGELGGWDAISVEDKLEIRQAWRSWLSSNTSTWGAGYGPGELVGADHPAVGDKYPSAGVVKAARANPQWEKPFVHGGKAWMVNHRYQELYSIPTKTMTAAPSVYAMSAPAEFFAECYAEYYREVDGTPDGDKKKGGRLAPWIKEWFDANVDRIAMNPNRLKKSG
jgi:hypothetical protein